jgi:hypothetical protein
MSLPPGNVAGSGGPTGDGSGDLSESSSELTDNDDGGWTSIADIPIHSTIKNKNMSVFCLQLLAMRGEWHFCDLKTSSL